MRAGIAASGIRPAPVPEWFGESETVPTGAGAVVLRLHTGSYAPYPSWMTVGGSAATLLGTAGPYSSSSTVTRLVSAWWCPNPGPDGELAADVSTTNTTERHHWTLYCRGLRPGEVQTGYNNSQATVTQHAPALDPGGLMLSCHSARGAPPVAEHAYVDGGVVSGPNVATVSAAWTVGDDQPTRWTSYRYHSMVSVALNPGV